MAKTLDEVIDSITKHSGLEIRNVRKPDKDRFWVDRETYMDALHYLKEYRRNIPQYESLKTFWAKHMADSINVPLTWDELRKMEGKPVWVETLDESGSVLGGSWRIIKKVTGRTDELACAHTDEPWHALWKKRQGIEWVAYRKERGDSPIKGLSPEVPRTSGEGR